MSDLVIVRGLRVRARVGWGKHERLEPREVRIAIDLHIDMRRAGNSDDLGDTVDYHAVTVDVAEFVRGGEFRLLEHLAEEIAARCLAHRLVRAVAVEVEKPDPPIEEQLESVAVRILRP